MDEKIQNIIGLGRKSASIISRYKLKIIKIYETGFRPRKN